MPSPVRVAPPGAHSRNMLTSMIGYGYPAGVAFLTGPILAQALGVEGRGAVAAAAAPLSLITTVATFGIPEAVMFAVARTPAFARAAAWRAAVVLTITGVLAALGLLLAAPTLSAGDDAVARLIALAAIAVVPSLCLGILRGVASARQRWTLVTREKIISSTSRLFILVPFWLTDTLTPTIAVISLVMMPLIGALSYVHVLSRVEGEASAPTSAVRTAGLLRYGSRVWIGSLTGVLLLRVDQALMTPLAGVRELGIYVVAVSIGELPLIIHMAIRDVTFISEASSSADDRLAAAARISTMISLFVASVLGTSMIWWLPLLFGSDFAPAVPVAAVILASVVLNTPGSIAGSGLSGRGRPGLRSWSLVVACVVNVALLVALAPSLGAMGAAISTLCGNAVVGVLTLYFLRRVFGISPIHFLGVRRSDLTTLGRFVSRTGRSVHRRR